MKFPVVRCAVTAAMLTLATLVPQTVLAQSALQFDGSGDYVAMGPAPSLGSATFTLECWFKRLGGGTASSSGSGGVSRVPLICKGRGAADGDNRDCNYFFGIRSPENVLAADFEDSTNGSNHPIVGTTVIQNDTWYHAAATYDGTTWRLYLNGQLDGQLSVNATPRADSIQHFSLATATNSTGSTEGGLNGLLDEVRVWNYARSSQQLLDNMNAEVSSATGLLGHWGLNEGAGSSAGNTGTSGVTGTIYNAIWVPGMIFGPHVTVVTQGATGVSQSGGTLHGELTDLGGETSATVWFKWGTSAAGLNQVTPGEPMTAPGAFTAAITGLVPGTTCYYRAVAQTASSIGEGTTRTFLAVDNAALQLNGSTEYVTMGQAPGLGAATFTLECWFQRTGTGQTANSGSGGVVGVPLICRGVSEGDASNIDGNYMLAIREPGAVLTADFEDTAGGMNHPIAGTTVIQNNQWYHAAPTYDGTTWRLYLNGRKEAELVVGATPRYDSIQHFGLGAALNSAGSPTGRLAGVLDEVRVWNFARSQADIIAALNVELPSAPGLLARWGLNDASGNSAVDSSGAGFTGAILGGAWVPGAPFNINVPPDAPVTLAPADGATLAATSASLTAHVADPTGESLQVKFFGRQLPNVPPPPFHIVAVPDTQYYSQSYPQTFTTQVQWIIDHKSELSIAFVGHEGDIVNNADQPAQWQNANNSVSLYDTAPDLPFGLPPGNHDENPNGSPSGTAAFNSWFPYTRYESRPWYGGHEGTSNDNHYILFTGGGMEFIAICMKYDPAPTAALNWAAGLLQTYANRRAILVTHSLLNLGDPAVWTTQGIATYNALKGYPNLFLMLCGHNHGEGRRTDFYNGNRIYTVLADYQSRSNGGDGWLRLLEFVPADNAINFRTYSPTLAQYETDADSQFTLDYEMGGGGPFLELATLPNVASNTDAVYSWTDLDPLRTYQWYAVVSDGHTSVNGPVSTFSTIPSTPGLGLSVTHLERSVLAFQPAESGAFSIANTGVGTLSYTITDDADWLSTSPSTGSSAGEADAISVAYDTAGLSVGTYTATITVTADGAWNSPQTVAVTLTVQTVGSDFDQDGDVDQEDFGHLQVCLNASGSPLESGCADADLNGDPYADPADVAIFIQCHVGPYRPAGPGCPH